MTKSLLAQVDSVIGELEPIISNVPGITAEGELPGIVAVINIVLRIIFIIAGVYAFFNIIIAGMNFIGAGGDPKKVTAAWEKIWQSFLGLVIIVSSFIIAAIIGIILFGDATYILNPKLKPLTVGP